MISLNTSRFRPQILIIFLIALSLLSAGVRVPESHPHRPKPTLRVVLENHHKSFPHHLNQCGDVVALLPNPPLFTNPIPYLVACRVVSPRYVSAPCFPSSGRSPPDARS